MTSPPHRLLSEQEYLEIERAAPRKSEFFTGEMFAMAGATRSHNLMVANLVVALGSRLADRPCQVYASDMRVKIEATGLYTYPDVTVVCGDERFEDEDEDTLLNPTLIVEVLSRTTEAYDRGEKFAQYRLVGSLQEYLLIDAGRVRVERYAHQEGRPEWVLTEAGDLDAVIRLEAIGCELSLSAVYRKVRLPEPGAGRRRLR